MRRINYAIATLVAGLVVNLGSVEAAENMSAKDAQGLARKGEAVLVDIRTPQEWAETGVAAEAHAITMHQAPTGFWAQLAAVTGGDKAKPVALICRTGNRSTGMAAELEKAGYTKVFNVGEGMAGSRNGPGWIKGGLELRAGQAAATTPPKLLPTAQK